MKRRLLELVLCAAIGAIATVAVAWRAAYLGERGDRYVEAALPEKTELWRRYVPVEWGHETIVVGPMLTRAGGHETIRAWVHSGPDMTVIHLTVGPKGKRRECTVIQAGWPLRALEGIEWTEPSGTTRRGVWGPAFGGGALAASGASSLPYPLRWMWPGFGGDTLVYAATAWLLVAAAGRVQRRARLDRRACPQCTYDLRATPAAADVTCPECGTEIAAAWLARPRQALRWWMVPAGAPAVLLGVLFLSGLVTWPQARRQLMWPEPAAAWITGVAFLALAAGFCVLAVRSYRDRAPGPRRLLSALVALAAASVAVLPLYVLVASLVA